MSTKQEAQGHAYCLEIMSVKTTGNTYEEVDKMLLLQLATLEFHPLPLSSSRIQHRPQPCKSDCAH